MGDDAREGRFVAGRYRIIGMVARGGMGTVHRARDERLERDVALKILSAPYSDDPAYVERFLSEARTAASISHPSLVHVYDSGSDGEIHYIAMELLEGYQSVRETLRSQAPMTTVRAVGVALEVLAGLRAVHAHGLLHCDVKSANVMVRGTSVKLIDFGIARSRADERPEGQSIGSLHYMAPEQLLGEPLSPATDIYSVGVVLYESLTGELPYQGDDPDAVAQAHVRGNVPSPRIANPSLSPQLEQAILRALSRDPSRRFRTAEAMAAAIEPWAVEDRTEPLAPPGYRYLPPPAPPTAGPRGSAAVRPPLRSQPMRQPSRGAPWGAIAIFVTVAAVAGLLVIGLRGVGGLIPPGIVPGATEGPASETPLPAGKVRVPNVVGMTEEEAIAAANAAELDWTLQWEIRPDQPPGVYAQDPDPGTIVNIGSPFTFWSYRP